MLVVTPYCHLEIEQLLKVLGWADELGGARYHEVLFVAGKLVSEQDQKRVEESASKVYGKVETIVAHYEDSRPWPYNPNAMFQRAFWHINSLKKCPWFVNEPDVIPLKSGWLDQWQSEYEQCGKPFMGYVVTFPVDKYGNPSTSHLTGNAVYPANLIDFNQDFTRETNAAWDMVLSKTIMPHVHNTRLYQHVWTYNYPAPVEGDKYKREATFFRTISDLDVIEDQAVVFHRNKDGSLIDRLRDKKAQELLKSTVFMQKLAEPVTEPVNDGVELLKQRTRHRRMKRRTPRMATA